ncbi:MAG: alpha/beta hydrolase [Bacteroidota bacterium]
MKASLRFLLIVGALLVIGIPLFLLSFFVKNDAPLLHGEVQHHIPYKKELTLDVYHPTVGVYEKSPVLVYFHGGAWVTGAKESVNNARFNQAFNRLREKGYAIVSPNYTLASLGKSPFPACIEDAYDVMAWLDNHADSFQFDLQNVGILGESAGGHIAMMLAFDGLPTGTPFSIEPGYLIDVYGPTDLLQLYTDQIPLLDTIESYTSHLPASFQDNLDLNRYLFGFDPEADSTQTADFTARFSPDKLVHEGAPNTLIIHGDKDRIVPINQSHLLKAQLDSLAVMNEFHVIAGMDHAFGGATDQQKQQTQDWIVEFATRHYQAP